jgi:translation initiation factor IF-3
MKTVKVSYNIGTHDLETKIKQVRKFLDKELDVKVELMLRGRENYLYRDCEDKLKEMFSEFKIINSWNRGNKYYLLLR